MDVVGFIGNIWQLLEAVKTVTRVCVDYTTAVKDASWELPKVLDGLRDLANVFEKLHELSESAVNGTKRDKLPTLKALCDPKHRLLDRCLEEIVELKAKLDPPSWLIGKKRAALYLAATWPAKKNSVGKILENFEKFKSSLNLALNCDESEILCDIQLKSQALHNVTSYIRDTTSQIQDRNITLCDDVGELLDIFHQETKDNRKMRILQWLAAPDPSPNFHIAQQSCQPGTGSWLLKSQRFFKWQSSPNSFLWLYGIPGCGKTVLSSTILKHILQDEQLAFETTQARTSIIYFYFTFNDTEKQCVDQMLRSLIFQLSTENEEVSPALEKLFSRCLDGQRQPTTEKLVLLLQELLRNADDVMLVLDALDESSEIETLAKTLELIQGWKLDNLHILATSRLTFFTRDLKITKDMINLQNSVLNEDIEAYIHTRLRTDTRLKKWSKSLLDEIEDKLIVKSGGMFRWVSCQLDILRKCKSPQMLRQALMTLPKTLGETYTRILDNIEDIYTSQVIQILQWLAFSTRPLAFSELAEVTAIDLQDDFVLDFDRKIRDPIDILDMCSSLVVLTVSGVQSEYTQAALRKCPPESMVVQLAHFSVLEYLIDKPQFQTLSANTIIAKGCLTYLLHFYERVSFPSYKDHDHSDRQPNNSWKGSKALYVPCPDELPRLVDEGEADFPLLRYAVTDWATHFGLTDNDDPQLHSLLIKFFVEKREACWIWFHLISNLLKHPLYFGQGIAAILGSHSRILQPKVVAKIVAHLVQNGTDIDTREDKTRYTALHYAVRNSEIEKVNIFLSNRAAINAKTYTSDTPLHITIENLSRCHSIPRVLLENGADLQSLDIDGNTPLHTLIKTRPRRNYTYDTLLSSLLICNMPRSALHIKDNSGRTPIFCAMEYNFPECVCHLLATGDERLKRDVESSTSPLRNAILPIAARYGNVALVENLLDDGLDIESKDADVFDGIAKDTALFNALLAKEDRLEKTLMLLNRGADAASKSVDGLPVFYHAISEHHYSSSTREKFEILLEALLSAGADMDAIHETKSIPFDKLTALHAAIKKQDMHAIEFLLNKGANIADDALHLASWLGNLQIVKLLLDNGADISARRWTKAGPTALHEALQARSIHQTQKKYHRSQKNQNLRILEYDDVSLLLIERGADVNARDYHGKTPLFYTGRSRPEVTEKLIEKGANISAVHTFSNLTAFHDFASMGYHDSVALLIKKGADVNSVAKDGKTALHLAVTHASGFRDNKQEESAVIATVEILLQNGADLSTKDNVGKTPLFYAMERWVLKIVELLLKRGADINARDSAGRSLLHVAAKCWNYRLCILDWNARVTKVIQSILEYSIDVDARDLNGKTAMHVAAKYGNCAMVKLLLGKGASVDVRDKDGRTPLLAGLAYWKHMSQDWRCGEPVYWNPDIVELLIQNRTDMLCKDCEDALEVVLEETNDAETEERDKVIDILKIGWMMFEGKFCI